MSFILTHDENFINMSRSWREEKMSSLYEINVYERWKNGVTGVSPLSGTWRFQLEKNRASRDFS